jgi:hypothetical protein
VQSTRKIAEEEWGTTFRAEDEVIMQVSKGLTHGAPGV